MSLAIARAHGCACMAGTTEPCFPSEPQKAGVGACKFGQQVCEKGSGEIPTSQWGACIGAGAPSIEVCNGVDDDCDGQVDEGCVQCSTQSVVWDIPPGRPGGRAASPLAAASARK